MVIRRTVIALAGALAVTLLVFAASATAAPPKITQGSASIPVHPLTGVCPFELMSGATLNFTERDYVDNAGNPTRTVFHIQEQDTFEANGVTLTSDWFDFNFEIGFDAQGNQTTIFLNGIVEWVHLPDGSLFISAGRVDLVAQGFPEFVLEPSYGGIHNLDGFCASFGV